MNNTNKTKKLTTNKKKVDSISKSTRSKIVSSIQDAIDRDYQRQQKEIDIPHLRGGDWKWNFEKKPMSLADKITWVLTVVNVAILISMTWTNLN